MEQISPVTILPQASYIDFVPTVERELDYKTLFSLEQQRATAEYRRKQDQINNRVKIQGNLDKTLSDPNSPLAMVGENPKHIAYLDEIRAGAQPLINEINALQANPNYDENAILNAWSKLSQYLYTNPKFREVIEDKAKWATQSKYADKLDPELWGEHQNKYYSDKGDGDNPLNSFNPALMTPWNEDRYQKSIDRINKTTETILPNGYKGEYLKSEPVYKQELDSIWEANKIHLSRQGFDKATWIENQWQGYKDNAELTDDGRLARVTDYPSASYINANSPGGTGSGDGSGSSGTTKAPTPPVQIGADGMAFIPNVERNSLDGKLGGTATVVNPLALSPTNELQINEEQKTLLNQRYRQIGHEQAVMKKQFGADVSKYPPSIKAKYDALVHEAADVGYDLKSIDASNVTLKNDDFYKSREYKEKFLQKSKTGYSGYNSVLINDLNKEILSNVDKLGESTIKALGDVSAIGLAIMSPAQKRDYLVKVKAKLIQKNLPTGAVDKSLTMLNEIETKIYDDYVTNNPELVQSAKGSSQGYAFDNDDPDVRAITEKYDNKTGVEAIESATGGIRLVNGTKYAGNKDEKVVTGGAIYDPITGTWGLQATIGEPDRDDDNKIQYGPDKKMMLKDPKQAIISDTNINRKLLHTFLYDPNNPEAPKVAEYLFPKLAKTVDLKEGRTTVYNAGGEKYQITSIGGGQYSVVHDGKTDIVNNKLDLASAIALKSQTQPTNQSTSGGGNGGKLESQSSSIKEGIRQAESGGEKDPARARNKETNALGYFGLVPSSQFDKLTPFVTKNWREFGVDLSKYTPEAIAAFKKELGRKEGAKGYSDEDIKAYMAIQDHPEMQDAYFDKVLMPKQYLPNVNKIIAAYAKNGKNINEAQAIDIMHHHGIGNAQDGNWQKYPARAWAASYQGENKKETQDINNRIKNYNFAFQPGVNLSGVNKTMVDSTKHLIVKSGLDSLLPQVSSGKRDGNGASKHNHGEGIDFKFNTPSQEMEAINKIAKMTANPEAARQMLLKGKGTKGNVPALEIKVAATGQTLKIIYHGDSDGSGNHLHIQL